MVKIALTTTDLLKLTKDHIAPAVSWKLFDELDFRGLARYNPDVLVIAGYFNPDYTQWSVHRALFGDIPHIAIHWVGADVELVEDFWRNGQRTMIDWLSGDRFLHIPCTEAISGRLLKLGLKSSAPLDIPVDRFPSADIVSPLSEDHTVGKETMVVAVPFDTARSNPVLVEKVNVVLGQMPRTKYVFYNWLPPLGEVGFQGLHEERFALSRYEMEAVLSRSHCVLMLTQLGFDMCEGAKALVCGRPVLSDYDLPGWPRIFATVKHQKVKSALDLVRRGQGGVPERVRVLCRDQFDPSLYQGRVESRIREKWG